MLKATQKIERALGRRQKSVGADTDVPVYHDRPIDIDILLYDDLSVDEPDLKIPHPLMHERDFVMIPLSEIRKVAGLKVAKAQYEQAYNNWQSTVLKAGNEVSNALVTYNSSAEKAELDGKRVKVLTKNVEDTKRLMESSSNTTYLEVITAQSNLLNAEIAEVTDQFNKMQSVVNLYLALGGGAK